jgi:hypothetical protein
MSEANIKLSTALIARLKKVTGEKTGQKAVRKAIDYVLAEGRQRRITDILESVNFRDDFDPLKLRANEKHIPPR